MTSQCTKEEIQLGIEHCLALADGRSIIICVGIIGLRPTGILKALYIANNCYTI